jgi:hypothetical protein
MRGKLAGPCCRLTASAASRSSATDPPSQAVWISVPSGCEALSVAVAVQQ